MRSYNIKKWKIYKLKKIASEYYNAINGAYYNNDFYINYYNILLHELSKRNIGVIENENLRFVIKNELYEKKRR
jgi:hypothetical protein